MPFLYGFLICFIVLTLGTSVIASFKTRLPQVLGAINQTSGTACKAISLYKNPSWQPLSSLELATITENTALFLVVSPSQTSILYDRARFRVRQNGTFTDWQETETRTTQGEYYLAYTIPPGTADVTVEAELHRRDGEWE